MAEEASQEAAAAPPPPPPPQPVAAPEAGSAAGEGHAPGGAQSAEERLRTRSTPVVRRIAAEHGVDIARVPGTGHAGRVTKQDILGYIDSRAAASPGPARAPAPAPAAEPAPVGAVAVATPSDLWTAFYREVKHPE